MKFHAIFVRSLTRIAILINVAIGVNDVGGFRISWEQESNYLESGCIG